MAKKKGFQLDTTRIKEYMVSKGERVALIAATALMVLLLLSGFAMGLGTRVPVDEITRTGKGLINRVNDSNKADPSPPAGADTGAPKLASEEGIGWAAISPNKYPVGGWFDGNPLAEEKVFNPYVLA